MLKRTVKLDATLIGVIRTKAGPVTVSISRLGVAPLLGSAFCCTVLYCAALYMYMCVCVCERSGDSHMFPSAGASICFGSVTYSINRTLGASAVDAGILFFFFFNVETLVEGQMDARVGVGGIQKRVRPLY